MTDEYDVEAIAGSNRGGQSDRRSQAYNEDRYG
jgi:hypothetical protein